MNMSNLNVICLDAEFADNEELLELSVYDLTGREIYHRFYRPELIKDWRTDIHHITPDMVAGEKTFSKCRYEVESILAKASVVTGFAVDNDLRVLERGGVSNIADMKVIDVRDIYWFVRGRKEGINPYSVPSLLTCANSLGLDFSEQEAHSASADTEATVRCFNALLKEYAGNSEDLTTDLLLSLEKDIKEAFAVFVEESARGYIRVVRNGPFYKIKFTSVSVEDTKGFILDVPVNDRHKAEYEIRKMLKKKEVPDKMFLYKLTEANLKQIQNYKNEYDAEESAWCKKVVRNLSRLSL